jgi:hypothetical protein
MRAMHGLWWVVVCLVVAGCSKEQSARGRAGSEEALAAHFIAAPKPAMAPPGTSIAYEHTVEVQVPGSEIPRRIDTVQSACFAQKFGDCAVLNVEQRGGDAEAAFLLGFSDVSTFHRAFKTWFGQTPHEFRRGY